MVSKEMMAEFLSHEFPQTKCVVEAVGNQSATVRHSIGVDELRPGGTVSGPVLMALGDVALYVAILGKCKLMKVGRSLVVGEVAIYSDGDSKPVAHVVGTYSIPPQR